MEAVCADHLPCCQLPVLFTINFIWKINGILMITGMHQAVKLYILYIQFGACFSSCDSDYYAMSVSLHVHVNCVFDVMWA